MIHVKLWVTDSSETVSEKMSITFNLTCHLDRHIFIGSVVRWLFKILTTSPLSNPAAKVRQQPTTPTVHDVALEVGREGVREGLTSVDVVAAEHGSSVTERNVVVVRDDLKLSESNTVVECCNHKHTITFTRIEEGAQKTRQIVTTLQICTVDDCKVLKA